MKWFEEEEEEEHDPQLKSCAQFPQMESIMNFVAERFSHEEMKVLQGVLSLLMSLWVREWQYRDVLHDIDDLTWEDFSEDWQKYVSEGGESPAL